jgi:hypothetical protein
MYDVLLGPWKRSHPLTTCVRFQPIPKGRDKFGKTRGYANLMIYLHLGFVHIGSLSKVMMDVYRVEHCVGIKASISWIVEL